MSVAPSPGASSPVPALLVLHEPDCPATFRQGLVAGLGAEGWLAVPLAPGPGALRSDRAAPGELGPALEALGRRSEVDPERLGVLGLGRAGTLAFLLGCAHRLAVTVDVDGPVLHAALSPERPTQPLELALNLEGSFLGLFAGDGAVGAEEQRLLAERLTAAARPFALRAHPGPSFLGLGPSGYDGERLEGLLRALVPFLRETFAPEPS